MKPGCLSNSLVHEETRNHLKHHPGEDKTAKDVNKVNKVNKVKYGVLELRSCKGLRPISENESIYRSVYSSPVGDFMQTN